MRLRHAYVEALQKVQTHESVKVQLEKSATYYKAQSGGQHECEGSTPGADVEVRHDQECYDFVKWWETAAQNSKYDFHDTDLGHFNIKAADPFEDVGCLYREFAKLTIVSSIALLKIKMFTDLMILDEARGDYDCPSVPERAPQRHLAAGSSLSNPQEVSTHHRSARLR
jgi:hypothetical protein